MVFNATCNNISVISWCGWQLVNFNNKYEVYAVLPSVGTTMQLTIDSKTCGDRVTRSLVLCVMFCRSLFVLLCFFFRPLCFLSFFDLPILITPLISSNSSYD